MKKIFFAMASCAVLGLSSCSMEINDNPNAISSVGSGNILPTAEMNLAATVGVGFNMYGGYCSEIYAQNAGCTNYLKYSQFEVTATNTQGSYTQLYSRVLQQLEVVRNQSANEPGTYLAATALRAYTFQMLVDAYGETPYSEALTDATQPKYDDGADVYAGIIAELEEANKAASESSVCANITFGKTTAAPGTAAAWKKFANSLLLKLYMRESKVVDNKAKIQALIDANNFITEDVVYDKCWGNAQGSYSPLFQEQKTITADLVLNYNVTATVKAEGVNDTRLYAAWNPGVKGMIGSVSGTNLSAEMPGTNTADLAQPAYNYAMPVFLMTVAEVKFFIAEFYATQKNDDAAKKAYEEAIEESFKTAAAMNDAVANVATQVVDVYPYDSTNPMENIGIQKWIHFAVTMMGFESWCEARRIGYPAFSDQTAEAIINNDLALFNEVPSFYKPGTLHTPKNVYAPVGIMQMRQRFDYSASSTQYNNNVPATKDPKTPVFWNK